MDVDWSHAIAPKAKIVLVHGQSNWDQDLIAAANYAVNNNLGDVISMSFGESDQCLGTDLTNSVAPGVRQRDEEGRDAPRIVG